MSSEQTGTPLSFAIYSNSIELMVSNLHEELDVSRIRASLQILGGFLHSFWNAGL